MSMLSISFPHTYATDERTDTKEEKEQKVKEIEYKIYIEIKNTVMFRNFFKKNLIY